VGKIADRQDKPSTRQSTIMNAHCRGIIYDRNAPPDNMNKAFRRSKRISITSPVVCCALLIFQHAGAASPAGDVVGKITVGYQGWFACTSDGSPIGTWWHYTGGTSPPTQASLATQIHCWPDVRQFSKVYQTAFTNFGNGQPATLFSSYDQQTLDAHFRWMAENGIDTAALQRFNPVGPEGPVRNAISTKIMNAAQAYGVKFYIMYDCSGWPSNTFVSDIESDWTNEIIGTLHLTNSPAYAMQNGKPVVCIWGFGFNDSNHPWPTNVCTDVINYFKGQGCYVIGGVPTWWRTGVSDSKPDFLSAYSAFDMLSPWMVGRFGNTSDSAYFYNNVNIPDYTYCANHNIDYQPCVLPGDTGQRAHGDLMWYQFANFTQLGVQGIYISMFDEFNEGNQIACTAENASMIPIGSASLYFTLDQDGTACSSDYYLRLTGDGGRMFRGQAPLTYTRPTEPRLPLVFPPAPAGLAAQGGNTQVTLNWNAVTGAADVLSYNVKRATTNSGPYTTIATNVGHISYTDMGLTNSTSYYYVVSAVNSLGESANSSQVIAMPLAAYAVNSGGTAVGSFTADAYFSGGSAAATGATIDTRAATNPAPQAVYQTERLGANTYTFTNLTAGGSYRVRLHFAEIYFNAPGIRRFNVNLNGIQVLGNYDIFADAGTNNKATLKEYTVAANGSGQVIIQYINIPGADNAKSSGIEVLPIPPAPVVTNTTPGDGQISLRWPPIPIGSAASYNVKRGCRQRRALHHGNECDKPCLHECRFEQRNGLLLRRFGGELILRRKR
jgi:hypothetical protein